MLCQEYNNILYGKDFLKLENSHFLRKGRNVFPEHKAFAFGVFPATWQIEMVPREWKKARTQRAIVFVNTWPWSAGKAGEKVTNCHRRTFDPAWPQR